MESQQHNLCGWNPDIERDDKELRDEPTSGSWDLADVFHQATNWREHSNQTKKQIGRRAQVLEGDGSRKFSRHCSEAKIRYDEAKGRKRTLPQARVLIEAVGMTTKTRNRVL
jgi:hypothetical protein